jgi:hypothetical protein
MKKHGLRGTRLYSTWKGMRQRCNDPKCDRFKYYGGRGIAICEEWNDFQKFHDWALANGYAEDLTLDRRDNSKGYNPDNCWWADKYSQMNNKRTNRRFIVNGESMTVAQAARKYGINAGTLIGRLNLGWDPDEIITLTPIRGRNHLRLI